VAENKWAAGCEKAWEDDTGRKWRVKDEKFQVTRDAGATQFRFCGYSLDELLSDVAGEPESFPGFREVPCAPYEDADVDRLVEMLWVSDHQEVGWDQRLGEAYMEGWMEEAVRDARDFLTRYAAFRAKK
jgi:hypothetical protein